MDDDVTAAPDDVEETPAEQHEDTATSGDATEDTKDEPKAEKKPRRNRRTESQRIAQLTAQVREREREVARLQEQSKPQPQPADAPKREAYEDYESYIEARAEWKAEQAAERKLSAAEKARAESHAKAQEEQQARAFSEAREAALDRGSELYEDFEEVVSAEDLHITPVMADALLTSKQGHDVWYHLGKHPEAAEKIAAMHPVQQIYELGKLEASLSGGKATSGAPKPTKPVTARGSTSNALSDKLSTAEWMKRRTEEVRKSSS